MIYGNIFSPINTPNTLPPAVAINAYPRYFFAIDILLYPSAFMVPIAVLCSSTIRVILVRLISAATRKNNTGKTRPIAPRRSAFSPYPEYSVKVSRS